MDLAGLWSEWRKRNIFCRSFPFLFFFSRDRYCNVLLDVRFIGSKNEGTRVPPVEEKCVRLAGGWLMRSDTESRFAVGVRKRCWISHETYTHTRPADLLSSLETLHGIGTLTGCTSSWLKPHHRHLNSQPCTPTYYRKIYGRVFKL